MFFAGVPPTVTEHCLLMLFSAMGTVVDINLFKPFRSSSTSKVGLYARVLTCPHGTPAALTPPQIAIRCSGGNQPASLPASQHNAHRARTLCSLP